VSMSLLHTVENATTVHVDLASLEDVLARVCGLVQVTQSVHILLSGDEAIQELNQRFRGIDSTTDVLTFPSGQREPFPLGDIAISVPYAERQAQARGVSAHNELIALIVHGVLHLVGYDDEEEDDKTAMQKRMNEIGELIGTPIDAFWTSVLHQDEE
jgi:probable rRNA maturation factor